jgi:glutamyl-tRNA reductase
LASQPNPPRDPLRDTSARVEEELREFLRWMNDEVVPTVRTQSSKALRVASDKLQQLADYMDKHRRQQP